MYKDKLYLLIYLLTKSMNGSLPIWSMKYMSIACMLWPIQCTKKFIIRETLYTTTTCVRNK